MEENFSKVPRIKWEERLVNRKTDKKREKFFKRGLVSFLFCFLCVRISSCDEKARRDEYHGCHWF